MSDNQQATGTTEMKRGIQGWQVAFIGLGGVIGSCYFLGMGIVIHDMGPSVIIAFGVVGVIVYGLMIAYAELLVNLPRRGTFVAYTSEFLGPSISTGFGWAFWFNWICYVPSESIAVSTIITALFGISDNHVAYIAIAIAALCAITIINLASVDAFARIESGLAITKCIVIIVFIILAFCIWIGLIGSGHFLGTEVNFPDGFGTGKDWFPNGGMVILTNMTVVLVTFQGTEIVGLTAAEAQNPDESVPKACRSVTYRIVLLYLVPIILILLIFPFGLASDENAVFADVMIYYHMPILGKIFGAVVLVAAFSCSNTGFYGTVRALFGLSIEGLAPEWLSHTNNQGNPRKAVLFTLAFMWVVLILGLISETTGLMENLYASLLSMSGFTGTVAWVGICASWTVFRRKYVQRGYDVKKLRAKVPNGQGWLPWFSIISQIFCLAMMAADVSQLPVFFMSCGAIFIPMIVHHFLYKAGKTRDINALNSDEKTFDEAYPPLEGSIAAKQNNG